MSNAGIADAAMKKSDVSQSIMSFIVMTIGYLIFKSMLLLQQKPPVDGDDEKLVSNLNINYMVLAIYLFTALISQLSANFKTARMLCNNVSQGFFKIFVYTFLPFFFVFCSIVCFVNIFPGWLRPFSNTFGYGVALMMGVKKKFDTLLNDGERGASSILTQIRQDKSMIINELSLDSYDEFMKQMFYSKDNILKKPGSFEDLKKQMDYQGLRNLIAVKQAVAESIWFLLAGTLSITISNNVIQNLVCDYTPKQLEEIQRGIQEEEDAERREEEDKVKVHQPPSTKATE